MATGGGACRFRNARCGRRARSIVAALMPGSATRISGTRSRCPWRSIAGSNVGIIAFNRLPQIRSDASQSTISASRTAAPQTRRSGREAGACFEKSDRSSRIACLR